METITPTNVTYLGTFRARVIVIFVSLLSLGKALMSMLLRGERCNKGKELSGKFDFSTYFPKRGLLLLRILGSLGEEQIVSISIYSELTRNQK